MTGRIWAYVAAIACRLCLALAADASVLHPMGTSRGVLDRVQSWEAGAAVGSHSSCAALSKLLDDARRDNAELRRDNAELRKLLDEREAQLQMSRGNSQTTALQSVPVQPDDSVRDASFHLPNSTIVKMPSSQALGSGALPHSSDEHSDGSRTSLLHRRGLLGKVGVKNAEEMRSRYSSPCWPARSSSLDPACRCITSQAPSIARPGADIKIYLDDVDGPGILLAVVHALPPCLLYRISVDASSLIHCLLSQPPMHLSSKFSSSTFWAMVLPSWLLGRAATLLSHPYSYLRAARSTFIRRYDAVTPDWICRGFAATACFSALGTRHSG